MGLKTAVYRDALPTRTLIDGEPVWFHPLPRSRLERSAHMARQHDAFVDWLSAARIVSESARDEVGRPVATSEQWLNVPQRILGEALQAWSSAQEQSEPNGGALAAYLQLACAYHWSEEADVITAAQSESVIDYYGKPIVDLTDGQLSYWLACRSVYKTAFDNGDSTRWTSLDQLRKQAMDLLGSADEPNELSGQTQSRRLSCST